MPRPTCSPTPSRGGRSQPREKEERQGGGERVLARGGHPSGSEPLQGPGREATAARKGTAYTPSPPPEPRASPEPRALSRAPNPYHPPPPGSWTSRTESSSTTSGQATAHASRETEKNHGHGPGTGSRRRGKPAGCGEGCEGGPTGPKSSPAPHATSRFVCGAGLHTVRPIRRLSNTFLEVRALLLGLLRPTVKVKQSRALLAPFRPEPFFRDPLLIPPSQNPRTEGGWF
jgi:hypothetical protein